jgi:hypothetical protein
MKFAALLLIVSLACVAAVELEAQVRLPNLLLFASLVIGGVLGGFVSLWGILVVREGLGQHQRRVQAVWNCVQTCSTDDPKRWSDFSGSWPQQWGR